MPQIVDCSYRSMVTPGTTAKHDSSEQLKTALDGFSHILCSRFSFQRDNSSKTNPAQKQELQRKACTLGVINAALHIDMVCIFTVYAHKNKHSMSLRLGCNLWHV